MSQLRHVSDIPIPAAPPPLAQLWREASAIADLRRHFASRRPLPHGESSRGAPLIVIPGFLANDSSTTPLREWLAQAGYDVRGWGRGINLGASEHLLRLMAEDIAALATSSGRPVRLVGWSLGGLYARETAKRVPQYVDRVVTLGSPFSGNPRANRGWWLYEWINGHPVDAPPIDCDLAAKPPVPTIALWSRSDGIVASACARGRPEEVDAAIEVNCSHIGFTFEKPALEAVVRAIEATIG